MEKIAREQAEPRTDTLVWGKNAVTELLKSGGAVDTVYLADSLPQPVAGYYTALAKQTGAVVKRVPGHKLQKICGTDDHQGVAARAAEVQYASLEDLFAAAEAKSEAPFLVLCDGVEDPHNLGRWLACPTWRRPSAPLRNITSSSTALTWAVHRWPGPTCPARWPWCWAARAAVLPP